MYILCIHVCTHARTCVHACMYTYRYKIIIYIYIEYIEYTQEISFKRIKDYYIFRIDT